MRSHQKFAKSGLDHWAGRRKFEYNDSNVALRKEEAMNNTNLIRTFFLLSALVACGAARAKTVALWPLENVDAEGGLHCVIDPRNDLSVIAGHKSNTDTNVVWDLLSNPDTDRHAIDMWRVSTIAYAPEDLLYAPPGGMTIFSGELRRVEDAAPYQLMHSMEEWDCG